MATQREALDEQNVRGTENFGRTHGRTDPRNKGFNRYVVWNRKYRLALRLVVYCISVPFVQSNNARMIIG